jgi:hypothetical protein
MGTAGSKWWTVFTLVGLAGWIGAVIAVGATQSTPQDDEAVTTTFVIGGAVFFSLLFGSAIVVMRRTQHRARADLFHRLAVVPVAPDELKRATAPMARIAYVYVGFGAAVTAAGLTAVAVGAELQMPILTAMMAVVLVWLVYAGYALAKSTGTAACVVRPLGLELTGIPSHHTSLLGGMSWMSGATSYAGNRHGRTVSISQTSHGSATIVAGDVGDGPTPRTPVEMAQLTGEGVWQWRGVTVTRGDDAVVVTRRRSGAGAWFLHDLLLAEAVATTPN